MLYHRSNSRSKSISNENTLAGWDVLEVQGEAAGAKIHHPEVSLARFPRRSWRHGESAAAPRLPKLRQAPGVSQRETGGDGCPSPGAIIKSAVALNTEWGCGGRVARRLQKPWVTYFVDGPYLHVAWFFLIATLLPSVSCLVTGCSGGWSPTRRRRHNPKPASRVRERAEVPGPSRFCAVLAGMPRHSSIPAGHSIPAHHPNDSQPGTPGAQERRAGVSETRLGRCTPKSLEIQRGSAFYRNGVPLGIAILFWPIIRVPFSKAVKRNRAWGGVCTHVLIMYNRCSKPMIWSHINIYNVP